MARNIDLGFIIEKYLEMDYIFHNMNHSSFKISIKTFNLNTINNIFLDLKEEFGERKFRFDLNSSARSYKNLWESMGFEGEKLFGMAHNISYNELQDKYKGYNLIDFLSENVYDEDVFNKNFEHFIKLVESTWKLSSSTKKLVDDIDYTPNFNGVNNIKYLIRFSQLAQISSSIIEETNNGISNNSILPANSNERDYYLKEKGNKQFLRMNNNSKLNKNQISTEKLDQPNLDMSNLDISNSNIISDINKYIVNKVVKESRRVMYNKGKPKKFQLEKNYY